MAYYCTLQQILFEYIGSGLICVELQLETCESKLYGRVLESVRRHVSFRAGSQSLGSVCTLQLKVYVLGVEEKHIFVP